MRTIVELTAFFDAYYKEYNVKEIETYCGVTYDEGIYEMAVDGGDASIWGLCGLASVIERPIVSVYPSTVNGPNDMLATMLNRRMKPRRNYNEALDEVYIMWTNTSPPKSGTIWRSNHFVPLVKGQPQSTPASFVTSAGSCTQVSHNQICHVMAMQFSHDRVIL